ncbi:MAG: 3-hydroxyacyl-CoA dehydrogenase NAD-binding domain-containing protein, partial [Pseudomonadota bacterium]
KIGFDTEILLAIRLAAVYLSFHKPTGRSIIESDKVSQIVHIEIKDGIGWVTLNNPPVNATSTALRAGLLEAVSDVQGCDLAVLKCAGRTFVAGGDMTEFSAPPVAPHLPDVVAAIENSAVPFVALMHGSVLGGGFEIAMACAFRVAKPNTRFGLPEVNMGLIPGAGGTQRAPRLIGWDMAVEMACLGQMKTAADLLAVGALDAIAEDLDGSVAQFRGRNGTKVSDRKLLPIPEEDKARFEALVQKSAKGRTAPGHNLTALTWASAPFEEAQHKERALHLDLRQSEESVALRHVFFAERAVTKPISLKGASPKNLRRIAIVGGGLMGSGIAAACLNSGYRVSIIERSSEAAETARDTVANLMKGALERGKITQAAFEDRLGALITSDDYAAAADADLAIEAVFEDLDAKRAVFQSLVKVVGDHTILATNTSYLDPDDIFEGISALDRCVGIHFFSPAHIMKLVEVVKAGQSSDATLATAFDFANTLRKTPVLVGICDGFVGNRILSAYRRAAEYLLADGALPHQIDAAMRQFGMAMGPFEAQDQSGLQIAQANRRRQDATRDPNERYVEISDQLCAMKRFGKRSGAGWYTYPDSTRRGERDLNIEAMIVDYSAKNGLTRHDFSDTDIQVRLLAAMANEGARIVEEGIAENATAVDVVKTAGYGFPRWRGGPMHWAKTVGHGTVVDALNALETASPGSWIRAAQFSETKV